MPVRMGEFSWWANFRNWSITGTVIRERSIEETELFLYGSPVLESKRRNQMRAGGGGGGGGHDADDCYLSSGGIFWCCTRKILLVCVFCEVDFVEIPSNTKPTPANSVQQNIVQRQSKAIAFPSRFPTSSYLFERIGPK